MGFLTESLSLTAGGAAVETTAIAASTEAIVTNIYICNESASTAGELLIEFYDSSTTNYYKLHKITIPGVADNRVGNNNFKDFCQLDTGDKLRFTATTVNLIVTIQSTTRSV